MYGKHVKFCKIEVLIIKLFTLIKKAELNHLTKFFKINRGALVVVSEIVL